MPDDRRKQKLRFVTENDTVLEILVDTYRMVILESNDHPDPG